MKVSVDLGSDPILKQLQSQFEALQKQLMKMKQPAKQDDSSSKLIAVVTKQQDSLLRAMERMVGAMHKQPSNSNDNAMAQALKGLQQVIKKLPDALSDALDGSYKNVQDSVSKPRITVKPEVTVNMNGLNKRLGRMEEALISAAKKSRNRTFGSNY